MKKKLKQYEIEQGNRDEGEEMQKDLKKRLQDVKVEEQKMKMNNFDLKEEVRLQQKKEMLKDAQKIMKKGQ